MKLDFLKYLSQGYYAMKDSKNGLDCLREFESKASQVKSKDELSSLVQEYDKKIDNVGADFGLAFNLASYLPYAAMAAPLAIPDGNIVVLTMGAICVAQLTDWTRRVVKFKRDEQAYGRWHSNYPYRQKFKEESQSLLEKSLTEKKNI